jgi:hypothetical protein
MISLAVVQANTWGSATMVNFKGVHFVKDIVRTLMLQGSTTRHDHRI